VDLDDVATHHDPLDQEAQERLAAGVVQAVEALGGQLAVRDSAGVVAGAGGGLSDGVATWASWAATRSSSRRSGMPLVSNMDLVSPSER
jgi:hypothetical protein